MSILIAIPQADYPEWMHKPYSEMVAAVEAGTFHDARKLDEAKWKELPAGHRLKGDKFAFGGFPTQERLAGYALFRDGGPEFTRPDTAALYMQNW